MDASGILQQSIQERDLQMKLKRFSSLFKHVSQPLTPLPGTVHAPYQSPPQFLTPLCDYLAGHNTDDRIPNPEKFCFLSINRHSCAVDALQTAQGLGIPRAQCFAVIDAPDAQAHVPHPNHAGETYAIAGYKDFKSLLSTMEDILTEHPDKKLLVDAGYGFLAENATFVKELETLSKQHGNRLQFTGPSSEAMELTSSKKACRRLCDTHEVPYINGLNDSVAYGGLRAIFEQHPTVDMLPIHIQGHPELSLTITRAELAEPDALDKIEARLLTLQAQAIGSTGTEKAHVLLATLSTGELDLDVQGVLAAARLDKLAGKNIRVKASEAGGGSGQEIISKDLLAAANQGDAAALKEVTRLISEARGAGSSQFGSAELILEENLDGFAQLKHVELQFVGDGKTVRLIMDDDSGLGPRDCSLQHSKSKKIVEFTLDDPEALEQLKGIGQKVAAMLESVHYRGAATGEFLWDPATQKFTLLEINTRKQVEIHVTVAATGQSAPGLEYVTAMGAPLVDLPRDNAPSQERAIFAGELRVNAETYTKTDKGYIPVASSGRGGMYEAVSIPTDIPGIFIPGFSLEAGQCSSPSGDTNEMRVIVSVTRQEVLSRLSSEGFEAPTPEQIRKKARGLWADKVETFLERLVVRGPELNLAFLYNAAQSIRNDEAISTLEAGKADRLYAPIPADSGLGRILKAQRKLHDHVGAIAAVASKKPLLKPVQPDKIPGIFAPPPINIPKDATPQDSILGLLRELGPAAFTKKIRANKTVVLVDTNLRDQKQSEHDNHDQLADIDPMLRVIEKMFKGMPAETHGGAVPDRAFLMGLDPVSFMDRYNQGGDLLQQSLFRGTGLAYANQPKEVMVQLFEEFIQHGCLMPRIFDACGINLESYKANPGAPSQAKSIEAFCEARKRVLAAQPDLPIMPILDITYSGNLAEGDTVYNEAYYRRTAQEIMTVAEQGGLKPGEYVIGIKDMVGTGSTASHTQLVAIIRDEFSKKFGAAAEVLVQLHMHGPRADAAKTLATCGADILHVAFHTHETTLGQPAIGQVLAQFEENRQGRSLFGNFNAELVHNVSEFADALDQQYDCMCVNDSVYRGFLGQLGAIFFCIPGGANMTLANSVKNVGLAIESPNDARGIGWAFALANKILADNRETATGKFGTDPYHRLHLVTPTSQAASVLAIAIAQHAKLSDPISESEHEAASDIIRGGTVEHLDPLAQSAGYADILAPYQGNSTPIPPELIKEIAQILRLHKSAVFYHQTLLTGDKQQIIDLHLAGTVTDFIRGAMGIPANVGLPSYSQRVMAACGLAAPAETPFTLEAFKASLVSKGYSGQLLNELPTLTLLLGYMLPDSFANFMRVYAQYHHLQLTLHQMLTGPKKGEVDTLHLPTGDIKFKIVGVSDIDPVTSRKVVTLQTWPADADDSQAQTSLVPVSFIKYIQAGTRLPDAQGQAFGLKTAQGDPVEEASFLSLNTKAGIQFGERIPLPTEEPIVIGKMSIKKQDQLILLTKNDCPPNCTQVVLVPLRVGLGIALEHGVNCSPEEREHAKFAAGQAPILVMSKAAFDAKFPNGLSHESANTYADSLLNSPLGKI